MPKNKGKGGKNRKRGKNEASTEKRELVFKEDGQEYAQVLHMFGDGRCEAKCIDGRDRLCHISGKMHKKVWIAAGDIILVGLRDYQDGKADVIHKYMPDEARLLKTYGALLEDIRLNEGIAGGLDEEDDDNNVVFEDVTLNEGIASTSGGLDEEDDNASESEDGSDIDEEDDNAGDDEFEDDDINIDKI